VAADRSQPLDSFTALAAGLHTSAAVIAHEGSGDTVSVELSPTGARSLLGTPASELVGTVVELEDLVGPAVRELVERVATAPDWQRRVAVLDDVLTRIAGRMDEADQPMARAWHQVVASGGTVRIGELAAETGYSRRHLTKRFTREYGITPKQAARVVRFERSWLQLRQRGRSQRSSHGSWTSLAELATACGYYDQAHLAREWNALAGCPPSAWLAEEELPFVQDASDETAVPSAA
jgi:AraC-like DNA-binding protein